MKKLIGIGTCMTLSLLITMTAFAGEWRTGAVPDENRWWYENDDGSFPSNGWFWLDGNRDGIEECYAFDENGWMYADTTTPDGYIVNRDGAWTVQGTVQTRTGGTAGSTGIAENAGMEGEKTMLPITIQAGGREFSAALQDNASTRALLAQLPMTITMNEMNGNEKYYYLPSPLPTDTRNIGTIHTGDLMLYGSDCLVLFYEDFHTSYRYTRLGSISDPAGLSEILGGGNVQVTFKERSQ